MVEFGEFDELARLLRAVESYGARLIGWRGLSEHDRLLAAETIVAALDASSLPESPQRPSERLRDAAAKERLARNGRLLASLIEGERILLRHKRVDAAAVLDRWVSELVSR